jgi:hypothetical protein
MNFLGRICVYTHLRTRVNQKAWLNNLTVERSRFRLVQ